MQTEQIILQFINGELLADQPGHQVDADTELLTEGVIDSLGVMRLVAHLEDMCGVSVPPEDVTIDHFRTVSVLAGYLRERINGAGRSAGSGA